MNKKWYTYNLKEAWIMEQIDPLSSGNWLTETAKFELRRYQNDGTVQKETLDYADAVTMINLNRMTPFQIEEE